MFSIRKNIKYDEWGLLYKNGKFVKLIGEGKRWLWNFRGKLTLEISSQGDPWISSKEINQLSKSELLKDKAVFLDVKDGQYALVWVDGRFQSIVGRGRYGLWTGIRNVGVEICHSSDIRLKRDDVDTIIRNASVLAYLDVKQVPEDFVGALYVNGELVEVLRTGRYAFWKDAPKQVRLELLDLTSVWVISDSLDKMAESDLFVDWINFVDVQDGERALAYVDGRFESILGPGSYGNWIDHRKLELKRANAGELKFASDDAEVILKESSSSAFLDAVDIPEGKVGVLYVDGEYAENLRSGKHLFWKDVAKVKIHQVDLREQVMDITGQEIMTEDKVSLRLNAQLVYKIVEARLSVENVQDLDRALYREAQLALRAEVSLRTIDGLLSEKGDLSKGATEAVGKVASGFGIQVVSLDIRDLILPGEMKDLMNQVIEAQKASEANVIKRHEETAAMRSQLNTAKLMENNPILMRLRELEVLESVSKTSNLSVVLGEKGLTECVTKML